MFIIRHREASFKDCPESGRGKKSNFSPGNQIRGQWADRLRRLIEHLIHVARVAESWYHLRAKSNGARIVSFSRVITCAMSPIHPQPKQFSDSASSVCLPNVAISKGWKGKLFAAVSWTFLLFCCRMWCSLSEFLIWITSKRSDAKSAFPAPST